MAKNFDQFILHQGTQIGGQILDIQRTTPMHPKVMREFLNSMMPSEVLDKDFRHILDYLKSVEVNSQLSPIACFTSLLVLPGCPEKSKVLGNFFGQKMNNISADLVLGPYHQYVQKHISLVSKRTYKHPVYLLLSLEGYMTLYNHHPTMKTIGNFLLNQWVYNIIIHYSSYANNIGSNICIDFSCLSTFKIQKTQLTSLPQPSREQPQIITDPMSLLQSIIQPIAQSTPRESPEEYMEETQEDTPEEIREETQEDTPEEIREEGEFQVPREVLDAYPNSQPTDDPYVRVNPDGSIVLMGSTQEEVNQRLAEYISRVRNIPVEEGQVPDSNDNDEIPSHHCLHSSHSSTSYQQLQKTIYTISLENAELKKLIYYLIKHQGTLPDEIKSQFRQAFLNQTLKDFGDDITARKNTPSGQKMDQIIEKTVEKVLEEENQNDNSEKE